MYCGYSQTCNNCFCVELGTCTLCFMWFTTILDVWYVCKKKEEIRYLSIFNFAQSEKIPCNIILMSKLCHFISYKGKVWGNTVISFLLYIESSWEVIKHDLCKNMSECVCVYMYEHLLTNDAKLKQFYIYSTCFCNTNWHNSLARRNILVL